MERSIKDLLIARDEIEKTAKFTLASEQLSAYYLKMAEMAMTVEGENRYIRTAYSLKNCNSYWSFNTYSKIGIKDKIGSLSCKNKFCPNCQEKIQASRLVRFTPELKKIALDYDIYHLVLSIPNIVVSSAMNFFAGAAALKAMTKNFKTLIRYFSGNAKLLNLSFSQYGFAGAIRSFEFVVNGLVIHPHIHCLVAFKKGLDFPKYINNRFSKKRNGTVNRFSDFEVLIQKIWFLLMQGQQVCKTAIDALPSGYSCYMRKVDDDKYGEIFKYVTKPSPGLGFAYDFVVFSLLEQWLYRKRVIQGYGVFHNIQPDDSIDERFEKIYDKLVAHLNTLDVPYVSYESLDQVLLNLSLQKYLLISRSQIKSVVERLYREESVSPDESISFVNDYHAKSRFVLAPEEVPFSPEQLRIVDLLKPFLELE